MDSRLLRVLVNIGLGSKQARTYLALLELGEATVQEVASRSGLKRTTLYPIFEELEEHGIVTKTKSAKHTRFLAADPEDVLKTLKGRLDAFASSLEIFKAVTKKRTPKPRVAYFNGADGFRKIWKTIFNSGIKEYLIITDPREMLGFVRRGYITETVIKEKLRSNIKSRQIVAFSEYMKEVIAKDRAENRVSKVLPHIYKIPFTTIIFGDRVALISPSVENMILIVESQAFAKTQTSLFESLWDMLPERRA
ncbi:hypothetical protein HY967_01315 [Candidatus Jorgensenbacteria bacterium]|nr:hypothetical protein [Candidatus Jorgensenbacteria bacterium]